MHSKSTKFNYVHYTESSFGETFICYTLARRFITSIMISASVPMLSTKLLKGIPWQHHSAWRARPAMSIRQETRHKTPRSPRHGCET